MNCVWPNGLDAVWAKSPAAGSSIGESLPEHTWQVLQRVSDLAALRPDLAALAALPDIWSLLFWSALLHDWGKAAQGFQAALRGAPRWWHRHEVLSLAFLDALEPSLAPRDADWVACVVSMHHKNADELRALYPSGLDADIDPLQDLAAQLDAGLAHLLWHWGADLAAPWAQRLGLDEKPGRMTPPVDEEGALRQMPRSMRKWLNRSYDHLRLMDDRQAQSLRIAGLLLRGSMIQSDHVASAHAPPLRHPQVNGATILSRGHITRDTLFPHQGAAAATVGSALLTAPTGSGKTEAALLWAAGQMERPGGIARLFYTLPYQASMNAMFDRLRATFGDQVGLLHGRSALALYRRLMNEDWDVPAATQLARDAQNLARLQVPSIRVFSPYHMLKATYQLKGYEAMFADFAGSAFIFDEIHAYEPARLAMILETVRFLRDAFGCLFFIMSATLPGVVTERIADVLGQPAVIQASGEIFRAFRRHAVHTMAGELVSQPGLEAILKAFRRGAAVLVTCNTVSRAQEVYEALAGMDACLRDRMVLIHGRFNARDRLRKEASLLEKAGLGASAREPVLIVATQVVEVSLNLDLDTIFTEPAPLDALVQRFGRVNRQRRMNLAPVHVFTEPTDGQGVYSASVVRATTEALGALAQGTALDEAHLQSLLDGIYGGDILREWEDTYARTSQEFRAAFLDNLRPFSENKGLEDAFSRLFDGLEILPASLASQYASAVAQRPLEAVELLVPISWNRWMGLRRAKLVQSPEGEWPPIVDVPYSSEMGLDSGGRA